MVRKTKRSFPLWDIINWFLGTALLAFLMLPAYGDYTARSQLTEGLSLASRQRLAVMDFYEVHSLCPTSIALFSSAYQISGKYTDSVHLVSNQPNTCYVIAAMRKDAANWVRGKHIMLALTHYQPYQVTCQTNVGKFTVPCPVEE